MNGGGRVEREYGLGRGALDLMIARYLDSAKLGEGWLVMFDLRKEPSWSDKLYVREVAHEGQKIHLVGC